MITLNLKYNLLDRYFASFETEIKEYENNIRLSKRYNDILGEINFKHLIKNHYNTSNYKALAYLSTLFNNQIIIEIGSRFGFSALYLSYNINNKIISYDILDQGQFFINRPNIKFIIEDIIKEPLLQNLKKLLESKLVFIDIDPHDGINEKIIIEFLDKNDYDGIVVLDDIFLNNKMEELWNKIKQTKYDISILKLNLQTGLGLIDFSNSLEII